MNTTRLIAGLVSILCYVGAVYCLWDIMSWDLAFGAALVTAGVASALVSNGK